MSGFSVTNPDLRDRYTVRGSLKLLSKAGAISPDLTPSQLSQISRIEDVLLEILERLPDLVDDFTFFKINFIFAAREKKHLGSSLTLISAYEYRMSIVEKRVGKDSEYLIIMRRNLAQSCIDAQSFEGAEMYINQNIKVILDKLSKNDEHFDELQSFDLSFDLSTLFPDNIFLIVDTLKDKLFDTKLGSLLSMLTAELHSLGRLELKRNEYLRAYSYLVRSLQLSIAFQDRWEAFLIASIYVDLTNLLSQLNRKDELLFIAKQGFHFANSKYGNNNVYSMYITFYLALGLLDLEDSTVAEHFLSLAKQICSNCFGANSLQIGGMYLDLIERYVYVERWYTHDEETKRVFMKKAALVAKEAKEVIFSHPELALLYYSLKFYHLQMLEDVENVSEDLAKIVRSMIVLGV